MAKGTVKWQSLLDRKLSRPEGSSPRAEVATVAATSSHLSAPAASTADRQGTRSRRCIPYLEICQRKLPLGVPSGLRCLTLAAALIAAVCARSNFDRWRRAEQYGALFCAINGQFRSEFGTAGRAARTSGKRRRFGRPEG